MARFRIYSKRSDKKGIEISSLIVNKIELFRKKLWNEPIRNYLQDFWKNKGWEHLEQHHQIAIHVNSYSLFDIIAKWVISNGSFWFLKKAWIWKYLERPLSEFFLISVTWTSGLSFEPEVIRREIVQDFFPIFIFCWKT